MWHLWAPQFYRVWHLYTVFWHSKLKTSLCLAYDVRKSISIHEMLSFSKSMFVKLFKLSVKISFWITHLGFLRLSSSANAHTPGFSVPENSLPLNIGLNILPLDSFMSCLDSLLGYSTGEFQALQLFVLAMFGAVDWPLADEYKIWLKKYI